MNKNNRQLLFRILLFSGMMLLTHTSVWSKGSTNPPVHNGPTTAKAMSNDDRQDIVKYASRFIGVPYKFGGASPQGFDCSGFTSYVLNKFGYAIPRTSGGQAALGRAISFKDVKPGDLVFFGKGKHIEHVAIVVQNTRKALKMVHSSTSQGVRVEDLWESMYWKKRLMFAVDLSSL